MRRVPSLRRQLFVWLLPVAIVALFISTLADYLIVLDVSAESHDQGLADAAGLYVDHIRARPQALAQDMPSHAQRVLLATSEDRVFFTLRDVAGQTLAGDARLPNDLPWGTLAQPSYFDLKYAGYWLRGLSLVFEADGRPLQLILATTALKREKLMGDILLGMLLPQTFLFVLTVVLVWAGIRHGLAPLDALRGEIAERSHSDLRPLDPEGAPDELRPIVREINGLLTRLDLALQAQRHFIADAAHQLRTPIAGLLAQVEAAGLAGERESPALVATARRLSRLIGQLLALSRAEPGAEPEREAFDLAALIRDAANDWLPQAFRREMDVRFELSEARLTGSPHALRELLANLLDNAIRYGREGGRIVVRCHATPEAAILRVEDDGPGIPPEQREKVFERFYRLSGAAAEGCGLGLPIVRGIARQHGGTASLSASPELGGLQVEVRLPRGGG